MSERIDVDQTMLVVPEDMETGRVYYNAATDQIELAVISTKPRRSTMIFRYSLAFGAGALASPLVGWLLYHLGI
jgi:hypothetical protein